MKSLTLAHLTISATPLETIDAACFAGFGRVGIRICGRRPGDPYPTPVIGQPTMIQTLRHRAAQDGVAISNISAYQFYPDVDWEQLAPAIETGHELGASIMVVNGFDPDWQRFGDRLARYTEAAAAANMRVALEFLPYSAVRNLAQALEIINGCGAPAGLLLDALHLARSGGVPADLQTLRPEQVVFAQLCDASATPAQSSDEALMHEARTARLPAGTGQLPLDAFLDALPLGVEIEYEVARADLAQATPHEKALAASEDAQRFMSAYAERKRARAEQGAAHA
ncbi:sugar phosphate isomerase/epimerase family protein [Lampropedia puyangensis]|uniref:sugar phosphate isomerase/epimerase family protein n=1 Tax=Lampropedia puyangensis TaxID=1330072 RepID=UPI00130545B8|nr:TIM barrel protein [Lampropedia puyangensis]